MGRYSPLIEKLMMPLFMPVFKSLMLKKYDNASEKSKAESLKACKEIFQEVSTLLEQNNPATTTGKQSENDDKTNNNNATYIFGGTKPTLADITFASLAYPIVNPPGYFDSLMAPMSSFPSALVPLIEDMRTTTAGKHALNMYKNHRYPSPSSLLLSSKKDLSNIQIIPKIMAKSINRN